MLDMDTVMRLIGRWSGTMRFFPSDAQARIGIAEQIAEFAGNEDQVRWLVRRLPTLHRDWPPMLEVRAVFCSKYGPIDGIEADSAVYIDGIPTESTPEPKQLASRQFMIAGDAAVSDDVEMLALRAITSSPTKRFPIVNVDVTIHHGEDEYAALVRACREERERAIAKPYTPSEAQIEFIKAEQDRNRKESRRAEWPE